MWAIPAKADMKVLRLELSNLVSIICWKLRTAFSKYVVYHQVDQLWLRINVYSRVISLYNKDTSRKFKTHQTQIRGSNNKNMDKKKIQFWCFLYSFLEYDFSWVETYDFDVVVECDFTCMFLFHILPLVLLSCSMHIV